MPLSAQTHNLPVTAVTRGDWLLAVLLLLLCTWLASGCLDVSLRPDTRAYLACCVHPAWLPRLLRVHVRRWGPHTPRASACCCAPCFTSMLCVHGRAYMEIRSIFATPDVSLQHSNKTHATFRWNIKKTYIWNAWNILRLLMKTLATWNTCYNMRLKQVKYLKHTVATYVYSLPSKKICV
jgi:hypothetical protein